jgi:tetratricopeptide (TPR) repeat protein
VNLAWWLETLAAPLIILSLLGAAAILVLRNQLPAVAPDRYGIAIGGGLFVLGLVSWLIASRRFENPERSLVRLEAKMSLDNALSAASAGVAPWPPPATQTDAGVRWHWARLVVPPLAALLMLAAGIFIPVSSANAVSKAPEQPQAWTQIESSLEHLSKEQIIDEKSIEETRKKLEELRAQKEDQWFSHSSLEATDALKREHRAEMDRVEKELERADKALEQLQKNGDANQGEKERQLDEFQQALDGLQKGGMKPNPQLLEKMKQMGQQKGALSKEQMEQLRENLKKNSEAMKNAPGQNPGDDWSDELLGDGEGKGKGKGNGTGEGEGDGDGEGNGKGKGGIARGPGHDPGVLGNEKDGLETGDLTGLESKDLSRALPGDLLELDQGEHDVDKSASKASAGGNTDATGSGGDRVWKESLNPDEQKTLQRYFK